MRVVLRHPNPGRQADEWVLVEMQGTVTAKTGHSFPGQDLGRLTLAGGKPKLLIGNHSLEGKIVKLSKPMVVLDQPQKAVNGRAEIRIVAKVREKYVFEKRPKFVLKARA